MTAGTNSGNNNNGESAHLRPTEAQLRWAQFHHKRRSQGVREKVQRMYQTPADIDDVNGAMPEDGNATTSFSSSSETTTRRLQKRRPKVSRGRRALLRVSRRTYQKRRREIEERGFRGRIQRAFDSEDEDEEDALNEIFMTKKSRRRRRGGQGKTDESFKRFQEACHAMMMSIAASATPSYSIEVPTKKWTRTADHIAAASLYDEYFDPKWGIRRRPQHTDDSSQSLYSNRALLPLDRGASWMIHLPKLVGSTRENPYYNDFSKIPEGSLVNSEARSENSASTLAMRAPGQKKFNQLVALVQQRVIQKAEQHKPGPAPRMHLRQFTATGSLDQNSTEHGYPIESARDRQKGSNGERLTKFGYQSRNSNAERERKTSYIPRMRLREFVTDRNNTEGDEVQSPAKNGGTPTAGIPKMRLRQMEAAKKQQPQKLSKALEIAKSLETTGEKLDSKTKQIRKSFEKNTAPKMRLRRFDFGHDTDTEEKKVPEEPTPRRKSHRLADRFTPRQNGIDSPNEQCCARCSRPSPIGSISQSDFFASVREMNSEDDSNEAANSSGLVSGFFSQVRNMNASEAINAGSSRVSDFFSRSRQENSNENEPSFKRRGKDIAGHARNSDFFAQVRHMNAIDADGNMLCPDCLEDDAVAAANAASNGQSFFGVSGLNLEDDTKSDASKESAVSEIWNRGRYSLNTIASRLNSISERAPMPGAIVTPRTSVSSPGGNIMTTATSMSGRVGGFFQTLRASKEPEQQGHGQNLTAKEGNGESRNDRLRLSITEEDDSDLSALAGFRKSLEAKRESVSPNSGEEDSGNDFTALAGYRKNQNIKRESTSPEDDSSSLSSYRPLPDKIRSVVKNKMSSPVGGSELLPGSRKISVSSPSRSSIVSHSTISDMSPEKYKQFHEKVIQRSALLGDAETEKSIIDTDDTTSNFSEEGIDPHILASLMLSPDLLTKRHQQAIFAIEMREWEQVGYLINANPWLVEMTEVTTNQYLLHKIAFFGAADPPAPEELCMQMIEKFPSAVHKFDQDGNVPLHLAAAAGHLKMITSLGNKFESGASIRNEDGMLPLHFAIASYAANAGADCANNDDEDDINPSPIRVIKTVLQFFPQAVAIADNDGNLPIHVAVECLEGGVAMDVIYLLLDEADRQLQDPFGARFRNKVKLEDIVHDDMSVATMSTERETDSVNADGDMYCNMVKNNFDETPLLSAIRNRRGWEVIEALVSGPGGRGAALLEDANQNNALHLLVSDFQDPAAAMSILKIIPETATRRNSEGMLPIEVACMQWVPDEVVLAIALVDLPFDIEDKETIKINQELGASWWYLVCECDDHYFEIVANIMSICTFQQRRALCFMEGRSSEHKGTVLSRATPRCRQLLSQSLRFVGRFEFVGNTAIQTDSKIGFQEFEAIDFGGLSENANVEDGRKVTLKCYTDKDAFLLETASLRGLEVDSLYTEEVLTFGANEVPHSGESTQQYCISIERAQLTLDTVVDGMVQKGHYNHDTNLRKKYIAKICYVLRVIAKALLHLHEAGAVHGDLCLENCGRFEQAWKLRGRLGLQKIGETFDTSRFRYSFPPEALSWDEQGEVYDSDAAPVSFKKDFIASPATDIWAFGKLAYEAIVGEPMITFDTSKKNNEDVVSLLEVLEWNESNMKEVFENLLDSGLSENGAEMITSCLFALPDERPKNMRDILDKPFWKEMRRYREQVKRARGQDDTSSSVFTDTTRSMYTETSEI